MVVMVVVSMASVVSGMKITIITLVAVFPTRLKVSFFPSAGRRSFTLVLLVWRTDPRGIPNDSRV